MTVSIARVEEIFGAAVSRPDARVRAAYLDEACADDDELRQRVENLLTAHDAASNFLHLPANGDTTESSAFLSETPGAIIGPYKLLQQIGEGGMGVVFMAEQEQPIQRTVALKIIKPGMDSRQVIARFEAERQALAMMEHPNIAKVLDAGTTESGRPYFVMELVKGVPITEDCDQKHLTIRERLELVLPVCQAVQHAHQKGIIHRDIKPTNILIAEYDNRPVPKVIDFGVAKATAQKLTERTMFTEFGQVIGTVEYMSPEQAKLNQLDIDTRSDIYSLGVLLYELLTGSTPFERQRLREAAFDEVLRMIREEEPPRPSTRLSCTDALPSVAANRSLEPKRLTGLVHGELDWIAMRCLAKDRNARYASPMELAADIQHWLHDEPVSIRDPDPGYLLRMWVRKNLGAGGWAISLGLIWGVLAGVVGWLAIFQLSEWPQLGRRFLMLGIFCLAAMAGPATIWLVRPKNRKAELIVGSVSGTLAAITFYTISLGWFAVVIFGAPHGIWIGMSFALLFTNGVFIIGTLAAGKLLRRYGTMRATLVPQFELILPSIGILGLTTNLTFAIWSRMSISWQYYAAVLIALAIAVGSVLAGWRWQVRILIHAAWIICFYVFLQHYIPYLH
jgi:serine/threonine protein kinase